MTTVLLLIHLMIAIALVGVILLQRSEGGALGIGGGGGAGGGFMTGRGAGNVLTKTTAILAACFFLTSMSFSILSTNRGGSSPTILPSSGGEGGLAPLQIPGTPTPAAPEAPTTPQAPQSE